LLHHGVVDRVARAGLEGLRIDTGEIEVGLDALERSAARLGDLRSEALQLLEIAARLEQEHAAVPVVLAACDEFLSPLDARLLDELRDAIHPTRRLATADVSIPGLGYARHDAESHQPSLLRRRERRPDRLLESGDVAD